MPEPTFSLTADDDLPRTVRRERDAREREAREREGRERAAAMAPPSVPTIVHEHEAAYETPAPPATVTDFDVPFAKMTVFFIKAVFAAIPALLILIAMLWVFGQGLKLAFPQLLQMKVDVQIYSPQTEADFRQPQRNAR
jgi:hypothetical protein